MVELALAVPLLAVMTLGAMDFGRVFYTSIRVVAAATAGAAHGSRSASAPDDTAGITTAAKAAAPDLLQITVTPTKLCGCSSGTTGVCKDIHCSPKYTYIQVRAQANFTTLAPYPGIPSSIPVSSTVLMRAK